MGVPLQPTPKVPDMTLDARDRTSAPVTEPHAESQGADTAERHTVAGATAGAKTRFGKHRWTRRIVVLAALLIAALGGYEYWHYRDLHPTTNDAYLMADVLRVAPQIAGRVLRVPSHTNQHVEKGQLLLEIDPEPFRIALEQADAQLDLARQDAAAADSAVATARADVAQRAALLKGVAASAARTQALVKKGTLPKARGDDAQAALNAAQAALAASKADLQRALNQQGSPGSRNARIRAAAATVAKAQLDLSYTKIVAPAPGILGKVRIRPGAMVEVGQALFPLVEDNSFWIDANYKETDLERIKVGQPASITVDIYPDKTFHGKVVSLSPASGAAFSLLPPENATGNWVKVTQRIPVRLDIRDPDPSHPLRIGASCVVTIDTTSRDR